MIESWGIERATGWQNLSSQVFFFYRRKYVISVMTSNAIFPPGKAGMEQGSSQEII